MLSTPGKGSTIAVVDELGDGAPLPGHARRELHQEHRVHQHLNQLPTLEVTQGQIVSQFPTDATSKR